MGKASRLLILGVFLFLTLGAGAQPMWKPTPFSDPGISDGETSVLRNRLFSGDSFVLTVQVIHADPGGGSYRLISEAVNGEQEDQVVARPDLSLRELTVRGQGGDVIYRVWNRDGEWMVQLSGKTKRFRADLRMVERRTLFLVLRGLTFSPGLKTDFPLFLPETGTVSMYARVLGTEQVTVPAGTFQAYKVEMGARGFLGVLAKQYLTYYWFDANPPHRFLRYEWPEKGQLTELVRIRLEE